MTIGIDVRLWNETGVGRYIRNLLTELQGIDKKNHYILFARSQDADTIKSHLSGFKSQIVVADFRWHSIEEQLYFPSLLYKQKLDLMHFPYFSVPIGYLKPYVITIHDLIIDHFPTGQATTLPLPLYYLKHAGYRFVTKVTSLNAKRIITVSESTQQELIHHLNVPREKIEITYESVDSGFEKHAGNLKRDGARNKYGKYFLYVGNAYPHKNLEKLLEAFRLFRVDHEDVSLVLVGKQDYFYKKLEEKVIHEKNTGIVFRHDVGDEELSVLYGNALAFVSPSLMEGFGLPPLEAMASSCIVIASDIPAFQEICRDIAFYFHPNEIHDIKEKLQFVYDLDARKRQEKIAQGLMRVKDFSWKKLAKQTLKVYESCVSVRPGK